jgi:hypothetical protein
MVGALEKPCLSPCVKKTKVQKSKTNKEKINTNQTSPLWTACFDVMNLRLLAFTSQEQVKGKQSHREARN